MKHNNGDMNLLTKFESLPRQCLISSQPQASSIVHEVCATLLPNPLLDRFLSLYPEVTTLQNQSGESIAHIICSHKDSNPEMIQTLYKHNPATFTIQDNDGNVPLHLVNSQNHSQEIIQHLLSIYPQALRVRNREMHTPLSSRLIRNCPTKVKAMIQHSNIYIVKNILAMKVYRYGRSLVEELFAQLHQRVSSICHNLQTEVDSSNFYTIINSNDDEMLRNEVEYLFCIMSILYYNTIEWSSSSTASPTTSSQRVHFIHTGHFWLQFPLFTKMILHFHPEIAFQTDIHGDLPIHILTKYNCSNFSSTCSICNKSKSRGFYYWVSGSCQRCTTCQTKYKRESNRHNEVPLLGYHGEYENFRFKVNIIYVFCS